MQLEARGGVAVQRGGARELDCPGRVVSAAAGEAGAGDGHLPQQTVQHLCQRVKMGMMTDSTFNNTIIQQYNRIDAIYMWCQKSLPNIFLQVFQRITKFMSSRS